MFMDSIKNFIDDNVTTSTDKKEQQQDEEVEPVHLLDLLRKRLIFTTEKHESFWFRSVSVLVKKDNKRNRAHRHHSFRNVKELRSAGIWLKPSKTSCLLDVSFNRLCCKGNLCLPPIMVDNSTGPKFMNLIAYEMCPDFQNDFTVTSYICFLDSLINGGEDVKELKDAGILYNGLGSDEEVADLFNKMNADLVPSAEIYSSVKYKMQDHIRSQGRWMSSVYGAFFSFYESSRTRLFYGSLGAIVLLVLTLLQTYYAMHQAE